MSPKLANVGRLLGGLLFLLPLAAVAEAPPDEKFSGKVVGVSDGDTISVMRDGKAVKVRLEGIDAPEQGQAYANVARKGLAHAVFEKEVTVRIAGRDYYNRLLGRIYLGEIDINLELVKAGLAWHNAKYSSDKVLAAAQKAARKGKKGLWQDRRNPTPPWDFRSARRRAERQ